MYNVILNLLVIAFLSVWGLVATRPGVKLRSRNKGTEGDAIGLSLVSFPRVARMLLLSPNSSTRIFILFPHSYLLRRPTASRRDTNGRGKETRQLGDDSLTSRLFTFLSGLFLPVGLFIPAAA